MTRKGCRQPFLCARGRKRRKSMQRYFKHKIENLINISRIVTVHYFEFGADYRSHGESHDFWEMVYADKNDLVCTVEGKEIILPEGEAIFHKPNEFHIHAADGERAPNVFIISFECKSEAIHILEGKVLRLDKEVLRYVYMIIDEARRTFDMRRTSPDVRRMPLADQPILGGMQFIKNLLELLVIGVVRQIDGEEETPSLFLKEDFGEYLVNTVIEYLSENVSGRISIDDVCRRMNYTRSYIFRQFKEVTGTSIMAYFTSLKIKEAKRLLRQTDMSVTEIAEALSFDTPNYFTKTFKRLTGSTPLQYRKIRRSW